MTDSVLLSELKKVYENDVCFIYSRIHIQGISPNLIILNVLFIFYDRGQFHRKRIFGSKGQM